MTADDGVVDVRARWTRVTSRNLRPAAEPSLFDQDAETAFASLRSSLADPSDPQVLLVGNRHPETSRRAAVLAAPRSSTQRGLILDALAVARDGLTAAEMSEIIGTSRNQAGARVLELRRNGWVAYAKDADGKVVTRATDANGNQGRVQMITEQGRLEWAAKRRAGLD